MNWKSDGEPGFQDIGMKFFIKSPHPDLLLAEKAIYAQPLLFNPFDYNRDDCYGQSKEQMLNWYMKFVVVIQRRPSPTGEG